MKSRKIVIEKGKLIFLIILFVFSGLFFTPSVRNIFSEQIQLETNFTVNSDWNTGYTASITIKNTSQSEIQSWICVFELPAGQNVTTLWGGKHTVSGQYVSVVNEEWNGTITSGQSRSIGFCVNNTAETSARLISTSSSGITLSYQEPPGSEPSSLSASFSIDTDWGSGYQATITLTNNKDQQTNSWVCEFDLKTNQQISSLWGGTYTINGSHVKVLNPTWSGGGIINPGASTTIGMVIANPQLNTPGIQNLRAQAHSDSVGELPQNPPAPPILNPIENTDLDGNYRIIWQASQGAATYTLQQDVAESFTNPIDIYTGSGLEIILQDQQNNTYYYRLFATNQYGTSDSSNIQIAEVNVIAPAIPGTPILLAIENDDLDGNYTIEWNPVTEANLYMLEESRTGDFLDATLIYQGRENMKRIFGRKKGWYYYRVTALNETGTSDASNVESVEVNIEPPPSAYRIVGYYTNWSIYRNPSFKPRSIDAGKITHINYAFAKIDTAGNIILTDSWADTDYRNDWNTVKPYWGNFRQLYNLKQENPHLKILISIGGWTLSNEFSPMASSAQARSNFVQQCIDFCEQYDCFDGVDIDWEYPCYSEHNGRPEDKENFTLLLKELYTAFKARTSPLLLTIAAPAGKWHYQNMEVDKIHDYLDWINIMTYDFHGPWGGSQDSVTNHHAPIYSTAEGDASLNVDSVVAYYLSMGVPSEKLVVGIPLYGRSYAGAGSTFDGLFSTYSGVGSGTTSEKGIRFFSDIKNNLLSEYTYYWDTVSEAPYLHSENPGHLYYQEFITYDNEASIRLKCSYIKENQLGGSMVWELGMDTWEDNWDAMSVIDDELQ